MNLRLYALRDLATNRIIIGLYFSDKAKAKADRDTRPPGTHCVTYGPDHRKYRG